MATIEHEETLEELLEEVESEGAPLDTLLEEILSLTEPPSPPRAPAALPTLPKEDPGIRRSFSNIFLTSAVVLALIVGCMIGFFWAKPKVRTEEGIAHQISTWIEELQRLYERVPSEEIIEPLTEPSDLERVAPTANQ